MVLVNFEETWKQKHRFHVHECCVCVISLLSGECFNALNLPIFPHCQPFMWILVHNCDWADFFSKIQAHNFVKYLYISYFKTTRTENQANLLLLLQTVGNIRTTVIVLVLPSVPSKFGIRQKTFLSQVSSKNVSCKIDC